MTDAWRWSPDLPENPYPKYADARLDPRERADVPFQDADDPEGAVAWLDQELERNDQAMSGVTRRDHQMINVPIPPGRRDLMAETLWVRDDAVASGSCSSCRNAAEQGPSGSWWHTIRACSDMSAAFTRDPPRYPGAPWPVENDPPEDTDWIPFQQGGWISGPCRFR
jgi:hypothetical protein